jgi:hypothetical protein
MDARAGLAAPEAVMSDNAKAYTSHAFQHALAELGARHILTPPYTPRWNGKLERFWHTLNTEWARSREWPNSAARDRALRRYLRFYNASARTQPAPADRPSPASTNSAGTTASAPAPPRSPPWWWDWGGAPMSGGWACGRLAPMRSARLLPFLAAAAAALAAPAVAPAATTVVTYDAHISGKVTTQHRDRMHSEGGGGSTTIDTTGSGTADFSSVVRGIRLRSDGTPVTGMVQAPAQAGVDVLRETSQRCAPDGCEPHESRCMGGTLDHAPTMHVTPGARGENGLLDLQVVLGHGSLVATVPCAGPLFGPSAPFHLEPEDHGVGTVVTIHPGTVGNQILGDVFRGTASPEDCPNRTPETVSCDITWEGRAFLHKVSEERVDDAQTGHPGAPRPITPPPGYTPPSTPAPAPVSTPVPGTAPAPRPAPPVVTPGKLPPNPSAYDVAIRCRTLGGCAGRVTAYPRTRSTGRGRPRAHAAAAPRALASTAFSARGDRASARLRFDAADRRAIRRAGGLRLVVSVTGAPPVTKTVTLARR